jgi:hypothetical protein
MNAVLSLSQSCSAKRRSRCTMSARLFCSASSLQARPVSRRHEQQQQQPALLPLKQAAAAFALSVSVLAAGPAFADLNVYEAAAGGEFGIGSAAQYGEANISGKDFSKQDLRRSNFTSAEARKTNFSGSNLQARDCPLHRPRSATQ